MKLQLIDKSALVADIKRYIKQCKGVISSAEGRQLTQSNFKGRITGCEDILSFIDSLEVKEDKWNKVNIKPPFIEKVDGNKYSKGVLCRYESGGYCIAKYVRLQTGYYGWFDGEEEVTSFITHWKELKD